MTTNKNDSNMALGELLAKDRCSAMLLFAAYIDDYLCHELYCEAIPFANFVALRDVLKENTEMRTALKESGVIESALQYYISSALDNYDMFYHFIDGITTILSDAELTSMIPIREQNLTRALYNAMDDETLTEDTWDEYIESFSKTA